MEVEFLTRNSAGFAPHRCESDVVCFQVSCLGVEPSVDGDDARFVLTSRNPDGSVVRFQLLASSPDICRAWVNDVVQILESQRNFLNGTSQVLHPPDILVI